MNLPNTISLFRFCLIPFFIWSIMDAHREGPLIALGILCLSGLSDMLDGYLARKLNQITDLGKILDPLADKLIIISAAMTLAWEHRLNLLIALIITLRELAMVIGTAINFKQNQQVAGASYLGKGTTCLFYAAVIFFLFNWPLRYIIVLAAIILSLVASIDYFKKAFRTS